MHKLGRISSKNHSKRDLLRDDLSDSKIKEITADGTSEHMKEELAFLP